MDKELLKNIVVDQKQKIQKAKAGIEREELNMAKKFLPSPQVIIISGIRRCGKSTLLKQIIKYIDKDYHYLNFDDVRLTDFKTIDFTNLQETFLKRYGDFKYLFFDEIQNINNWEIFIRTLRDDNYKVFVTGSNASLLSRELGTRLTGRHMDIVLYPFSFKEFLKFHKIEREKNDIYLTEKRIIFKKYFDKYILHGGMPEYLQTKDDYYLKHVYEDILYRDIITRYNIDDDKILRELSYYLMSNFAALYTNNNLKKIFNLGSANTIKKYIGYLENSYLFFTISPYYHKLKKQINSPKKIYSIDTGLVNAVSFRFSENKGRLLENIVFLQLKRIFKEGIYYYKTKNGLGVDFLVKEKNRVKNLIQVSWDLYDQKAREREIKSLLTAMDELKLKEGIVLTYDEEDEIKKGRKTINIIPVWKWLLEDKKLKK